MATIVLIVDDSKLARIVIAKTLKALQPDWDRLEAANAEEAMAMAARHPVDVVLIDYNMPGKDGLTLAAELREVHPTQPIALITANVQDEIIARAHALDVAFVGKPLTEDGLRGFISGAALRLRAAGI